MISRQLKNLSSGPILASHSHLACALLLTLLGISFSNPKTLAAKQPNILWIFAEDTSPWMGCYGDEVNRGQTPNIDSLANQGIRFSQAFVPAPVCSACRSALMAGQSQIRFNAHEHRSSRGPVTIELPADLKLLPQLMMESGYFTFNMGKTDYNFAWDQERVYSLLQNTRQNIPWREIKKQQPFFGQVQTAGGKNNTKQFPAARKTNPSNVVVPPDYPQNDLYHEVVAEHYDSIRKDDDFIGQILKQLDENGLRENTIIVYFSDHGANHLVRHKQMPTEGGLHVPFIIAGPDPYVPATSVRDDLVNMLDLTATTLAWAGIERPSWYEGQNLFAEKLIPRSAVFSAKDRLDHTIDRVRSVRSDRFRYTRNYKTDRIFLQPQYRDKQDYVINLRDLYSSGKLSDKLKEIYFGERPNEELYDIKSDPSQLFNLAKEPTYAKEVQLHRALLDTWLDKGDTGATEEPSEELAYQASGQKWGEGVNPEYESVRADRDGDGLSDEWERINGRSPSDGRILFTFDCGGWQTEGWTGDEELENLAGFLGYLEFQLPDGNGNIRRDGLSIIPSQHPKSWMIRAKATSDTRVKLFASFSKQDKRTLIADLMLPGNQTRQNIPISNTIKTQSWGNLVALEIQFDSKPQTRIELDSISAR